MISKVYIVLVGVLVVVLVGVLVRVLVVMGMKGNYFNGHYKKNLTTENLTTVNLTTENLTTEDFTTESFDIQYQVKGLETMPENDSDKKAILSTIQKAIDKVKKIITKSNKLNYNVSDPNVPIKTINDLYVTITISDDNIKEESGADSKDTVGGSNIVETQKVNEHIFPVIGTIQLLKKTTLEDVKVSYDVAKYPYTAGLNRFYYVFLHELLHVLGVGFLWTEPDYVEGNNDGNNEVNNKSAYNRFWITDVATNPAYVGPSLSKYNGLSATVFYYAKQMGLSGKLKKIPIENNGEPGTKLWHWEQGIYRDSDNNIISEDNRMIDNVKTPGLDNEIMVGWGTDKAPYISVITIANLEDLGYQVNYNEADLLSSDNIQIDKSSNYSNNKSSTTSNNQLSNTTSNNTTSNNTLSNNQINDDDDEHEDEHPSNENKGGVSTAIIIIIIFLLIIIASGVVIFFI